MKKLLLSMGDLTISLQIAGSCDLIINCTGLGSHDLEPDSNMQPVRGQVLRVRFRQKNISQNLVFK